MFDAHGKIVYDKFRGIFDRGREEACPQGYLLACNNMTFGQDSMKIRRGQFQIAHVPTTAGGGWNPHVIADVFRIVKADGTETWLVSTTAGHLFYTGFSYTSTIASIGGWDGAFNAVQIGTRTYFLPLDGASPLYVYDYTWTAARIAGGDAPTGTQIGLASALLSSVINPPVPPDALAANLGIDAGFHIIAVLFETNTGYITSFSNHAGGGPPTLFDGTSAVNVTGIPLGPANVVKRHLIATKVISAYDGTPKNYEFFFIPKYGQIDDNTTTSRIVWWLDNGLVDSADAYVDQVSPIPPVGGARRVTLYNGRLIVVAPKLDRNACYISRIGEPESFDAVNSILIFDPRTYRGIEDVAEHRGNLYLFSDNSIAVTQDDDTPPNEWRIITVDKSRGINIGDHDNHPSTAIAQYNHQPVAIDGQLLCYSNGGIHTFDGSFGIELTWAIKDKITNPDNVPIFPKYPTVIVNPTTKVISLGHQDYIYMGDYAEGLAPDLIKWGTMTFNNNGENWPLTGLYKLYGDGSRIIFCNSYRILGWEKASPMLYDTIKDQSGTSINIGIVGFFVRFPYIYPDDGWIYQFNELISRCETVNPLSPDPVYITLYSLDDTKIVSGGNLIAPPQRALYRKWFNFKSEACSISLLHNPPGIPVDTREAIELDIKNLSLSFKQLWAARPRSVTV